MDLPLLGKRLEVVEHHNQLPLKNQLQLLLLLLVLESVRVPTASTLGVLGWKKLKEKLRLLAKGIVSKTGTARIGSTTMASMKSEEKGNSAS